MTGALIEGYPMTPAQLRGFPKAGTKICGPQNIRENKSMERAGLCFGAMHGQIIGTSGEILAPES